MNQSIHKLISNLDREEFEHICKIINYKYDPKKKLGKHDSIVYFIRQTSEYRYTNKVTKEEKLNIFFINSIKRLLNICLKDNICEKYNINRNRVKELKAYIKNYLSSVDVNKISTDFCINISGILPSIFNKYNNLLRNSIDFKTDLNEVLNKSINKINKIIYFGEKKEYILNSLLDSDGDGIKNMIPYYKIMKISNGIIDIEKENRKKKKLFEIALIIYINEYKRRMYCE